MLIANAPSHPHLFDVIVAAVSNPMWPTDE